MTASPLTAAASTRITCTTVTTPIEWKLTLIDSNRSFTAAAAAVDGNTVTIACCGATVGTNEYISAVILDSSNDIKYYGDRAAYQYIRHGDDRYFESQFGRHAQGFF